MKFRVPGLLTTLIIALGMVTSGDAIDLAVHKRAFEPPLRIEESTENIITDLEYFIPRYMRDQDIPGVGVTLIRDHQVVWTEGFGVANSITRKPITADTVFSVASNSKVVTSYIAMRLVDQGRLSLDQPLNNYLPDPWLPDSPYRDQITLRHVASHSSGMTQIGKQSVFPPGSSYYYSGMGISYLQTVIEQVTGKPLETLARDFVFEPLEMHSASFINRPDLISVESSGHIIAAAPVLLALVSFAAALLIVTLVGLLVTRLRRGTWRPTRRAVAWWCAAAFLLSLLPVFLLLSTLGFLEFAWLIAFCELAILLTLAAAVYVGSRLKSTGP
jgi:CubicO group peptidase (beta-lactamase class C family)